MHSLVLYGRERCHLCEEMEEDIQAFFQRSNELGAPRLELRDVDQRADWKELYGNRVPVLATSEGIELCSVRLDDATLTNWLAQIQALA